MQIKRYNTRMYVPEYVGLYVKRRLLQSVCCLRDASVVDINPVILKGCTTNALVVSLEGINISVLLLDCVNPGFEFGLYTCSSFSSQEEKCNACIVKVD